MKTKDFMRVGDRLSNHENSRQLSVKKIKELYNSPDFEARQRQADVISLKSKVNDHFWNTHKMCPNVNELSQRETTILRSNFKILIIGDYKTQLNLATTLRGKLCFKNTVMCNNLKEAKELLKTEHFNVVLTEATLRGETTLKLSELTANMIVMSGYNEAQRKNIVKAGIKAFPTDVKKTHALALKVVLTMYEKTLG